MLNKNAKVLVAGGTGMVGSAIIRKLYEQGHTSIIATYRNRIPENTFSKELLESPQIRFEQLDLMDPVATTRLFAYEKPEYVILAAAKVGGIIANNTYRAQFIYENLQIQNHIIHHSYLNKVKKLLFLGSSCIYPKNASQPISEDALLSNELEYTNEPYAIAKIAGIKMCESYNLQYGTNFISVMPTNLYGYNDNYDLEKSHVLPALIRKMHLGKCLMDNDWKAIKKDFHKNPVEGIGGEAPNEAILQMMAKYGITVNDQKQVQISLWGTGNPLREFLFADDMAAGSIFVLENIDFKDTYSANTKEIRNTHINLGAGTDLSIRDLAETIKKAVGYRGEIFWDTSKPDGTARKLMNSAKMNALGWKPIVQLEEGISKTYTHYCQS
jgi:GDP-L-fucose synthase